MTIGQVVYCKNGHPHQRPVPRTHCLLCGWEIWHEHIGKEPTYICPGKPGNEFPEPSLDQTPLAQETLKNIDELLVQLRRKADV